MTEGSPSDEAGGPAARALADQLLDATGASVQGILLFGSRLVGSSPDPHSAFDFVVVVDAYRPFYRALVRSGHHPRSPRLLSALARILPPNIIPFGPEGAGGPVAKCMIFSRRDFERALGPGAKDHFLKGRMMQSVAIVHAADPAVRRDLEALLRESRLDALTWVAPHLHEPFTPAEFAHRMLRVSYGGEVRPESRDRVDEVFAIQQETLEAMYGEVLEEQNRRGALVRDPDGRYGLARPPGRLDRMAHRIYFIRSKVRATLRWSKHIATYPDWLSYIQRKVERRTGQRVELTARERRHPLIFLWPKVFRVLRSLPSSKDSDT